MMEANINNIKVVYRNNQYHIITEFSQLSVEVFNTKEEADQFIIGYSWSRQENSSQIFGYLLRKFVERDIKNGVIYKKLREVDHHECNVC